MSVDVREISLHDAVKFIVDNRGKTVPTADNGIPLIATNCIKNNGLFPVFEKIRFVSEETYKTWFRSHPEPGDIIFVNKGTPGRVCLVPNPVNFCIAQDMVALRVDESVIYPKYLFAALRSDYIQNVIENMHVGTLIPHFKKSDFERLMIPVPDEVTQKYIGNLYYDLSMAIELNNQINKTLEEMAQAIFKSWFVDFEPFKDGEFEESELGLIPKGWRVGCIGDYVKVKSGFAFKSSWWETSGVPVIKIKEIDNYTINFGDVSYVSEDKAALAKDFRVNGGDLLIAMTGATIGKFAIVPKMPSFAVVNQRVGKFFLGDNPLEKLGFIYCILKQDNVYKEIVSRGEGSAQPNISPSGIESIKIVLPPERLINEYNQLVMKFFKMIIENTAENALLICLRDTLLPKLMSGEIRVPVEEVV